ncbi:MAG: anaerobic sulfatase-maturation protein [Bacteroidales bacterium]
MTKPPRTVAFNPLSFPIYVMAKPTGALCNLDCQYCYYLEKNGLYKGSSQKMSDEILELFIANYIECQPTDEVYFTWHGGESLLRGIEFFRKAIKYEAQYARGRKIFNSIQTNGILLNDEWCRFFKDNDFLVGISLDGTEHIHNRYRLDKSGHGTFVRVMRGVELLQRHNVEFNTLSVITDYGAKFPLEIYRFFKEIGSRYMQFTPIVERWGDRDDGLELLPPGDGYKNIEMPPWCVDPNEYGDFYCRIFDEWVRNDVGDYYVQLFDATLAGTVGEQPGVCIYAKSCGHASAIEYNGDVYSCDHFVFPEYKLGNIRTNGLVEMMLSEEQMKFGRDKRDKLPRQCFDCKFLNLCNGECPKNRISRTAEGETGLNYLCAGLKKYFAHSQPYMKFMANELANGRPPANVMEYAKNCNIIT